MLKRILLTVSFLGLFASTAHADLDAYANYYSTTTQVLNVGEAVAFEYQHEVKKFSISDYRKVITCLHEGYYLITFSAVGERTSIGAQNLGAPLLGDDSYGRWGLALKVNGNLVDGSSVNVDTNESISFIGGQVVIKLCKNDEIELVNNTHGGDEQHYISIEGEYGDISATIALVQIDD